MLTIKIIERNGVCLLPCPLRMTDTADELLVRKVGSAGCYGCERHRGVRRGYVLCN